MKNCKLGWKPEIKNEAGRFVQRGAEDYLFSSARNYADLKYELEIYTLPKQLITV